MNLGELRTRTRRILDEISEAFWLDLELDDYINTAYKHYYQQLINVGYHRLLSAPTLLTITSGTETVALPSDFFKDRLLERVIDTRTIPLHRKDRYETSNIISGASSSYYLPNYTFRGSNIVLEPTPSATFTNGLKLHYYPIADDLSLDADEPVAGFISDWHRMLPWKAAEMAKGGREEEDIGNITNILARLEQPFLSIIEDVSQQRQFVEPFNTN